MKRKLLLFTATLLYLLNAIAQNAVVVPNVAVPQGKTGVISVQLNNDKEYTAFTLKLNLPAGISVVADSETKGARMANSHSLSVSGTTGTVGVGCLSSANALFSGTSGELFTITVAADAGLDVGDVLNASVTEARFSTTSGDELLADVNFTITIADPRIVLDENSTTAPEDADGVNVLVRRTINANEWSTICLPFAMSVAQVEAAFGDDVELADFNGIESTLTLEGDYATDIMVKFVDATTIEANHPYLIKVSSAISEFTVDGVDIVLVEKPSVDKDELITGSGKPKDPYHYFYNSFVGTYVANTDVPNLCLFLSGNKFWYSKGLTKMKAFRGYFDFYDVLAEADNQPASSKIRFNIGGGTTAIEGCITVSAEEGIWHTLDGRSLSSKPATKGVYIVNRKKVLIK